jgi:hypothetical protein
VPIRHARTQFVVAVIFAAVFVTAGCAPGTQAADPTAPASTVSAVEDPAQAPVPVETTPVVVPVVGQAFAKGQEPANLPAGQALYELFDAKGDYTGAILLAVGQPLPETVKAAIVEKVASVEADTSDPDQLALHLASLSASMSKTTGRHVILIFKVDGVGPTGTVWATSELAIDYEGPAELTADKAVARTQAWIAKQTDPASYEIVVANQ